MNYATNFDVLFLGLASWLPRFFWASLRAGFWASALTLPRLSLEGFTSSAIGPAQTSLSFVLMERRRPSPLAGIIGPPELVPMAERRCSNLLLPFLAISSR